MNNFFKENREKFAEIIEDNSIALFFAGEAPVKRGDEHYPFVPDRNIYYLTGCDKDKFVLLAVKTNQKCEYTLFIVPFDEEKAKWVGAVLSADEYKKITGIENIKYLYDFEETISKTIFSKQIKNVYFDLENRYFNTETPALKFAEKISANYPNVSVCDSYYIIAELRKIKRDFEINNILKAINITKDGIYSMMKNAKPKMKEYEIEAYFSFELAKNGVRHKAFDSIAASGKNATILHYSENSDIVGENDLILCDVGASWGWYSADITRTFPVSGKFTERQKQIYNIVLEGQLKVINSIRPGIPFSSLNEILKNFYAEKLTEIGLINSPEEVSKYYYHGVSHLLGLETHDAGRHNEGNLVSGMVFTVEPGLYIAEEGIGIRIEDNVIVTENGCDVLSKDIIKTVEDIENFMNISE